LRGRRSSRRKNVAKALLDVGATIGALVAAGVARHDFHVSAVSWGGLLALAMLAAMCQVFAGIALGLYVGRWKYGSFDEIAALGRAVLLTTAFCYVVDVVARGPRMAPRTVPLVGGVAAFVAMGALRFAWRLRLEHQGRRPRHDAVRLLVFGAGEGGTEVIRSILNDQSCTYQAVALLDDDPGKRNLRLMGVPVVCPSNTPDRISTLSGSRRLVAWACTPGRRRASSASMSAAPSDNRGGQPSMTAPKAGP